MRLKIKNFGALSGEKSIDLTAGINSLIGPNGCGKSTIVGALFFAVTGESITHCNNDDLISWGHDLAEVTLESGDSTITRTITRGKGSKASFKRGDLTLSRREEIDEAILATYNIGDKTAFRQVYFAEQFKAIDILEGTNSKRLEALSALLGFGKFEKYRDALKQLANKVFVSRVDKEFMDMLLTQLAETNSRCSELSNELTDLAGHILPESDVSTAQECANAVSEETVNKAKDDLTKAKAALDEVEDKIASIHIDPMTPAETISYSSAVSLRTLKSELAEAERTLASVSSMTTPSVSNLQSFRSQSVERKMAHVAEREQYRNRLNLMNDGKCPITGGEPCSDLIRMSDPASINAAIEAADKAISEVDKDIADLDEYIALAIDAERKISIARAEVDSINKKISAVAQYETFDIEAYEEKARKLNEVQPELSSLAYFKTEKLKELALAESAVMDYEHSKVLPSSSIDAAKKLLEEHKQASAKAAEKSAILDEAMKNKENITQALQRAEIQNDKATKGESAVEFLEFVRWALHKDNLPRLLVANARKEINKKLAVYLELFDFPYVVQWTAQGGIDYVSSYGEQLPAASLSGGQKYMLAVANRCAAADLLGSTFPLMVLDEPTTGLDDDNRSKMAIMLQKVAQTLNGRGVSLLIPTHDDELLSSANIIRVKEL